MQHAAGASAAPALPLYLSYRTQRTYRQ
jgi:hypothetical protein